MRTRQPALAFVVLTALTWAAFSGRLLRGWLRDTPLAAHPQGLLMVISAIDLALMVALMLAVGRVDLRTLVRLSGLATPLRGPGRFALALFVPAAAVCALSVPLATEPTLAQHLWVSVAAPFWEELSFRGLAVGALLQLCGWRFVPAVLVPAALFGLAHFWQGKAPGEVAGVVAITGLGGAFFAWLYVRWRFSLWPPLFVHAGLNALWSVFDLGSNALGGWLGNVVRVAVVAGAIVLTLRMVPPRG